MGWGHIQVDTANPFNKWVGFVFRMRTRLTHLTRLAYKVISYFDIITKFIVFFLIFLLLYL